MIEVEMRHGWVDSVIEYYEALYHDLKTPLALLFGYVQAMEKLPDLPDAACTYLDEIKRNNFRMAKLVRDANDRSRLNRGLLRPRFVNTDAVALLGSLCESARPLMARKDIRLRFKSPLTQHRMAMDREIWERIVLNLLANAKDFSPSGSEIHCTFWAEGDRVCLSVRDFGSGVSAELADTIFAPHTGETGRGLRSGLGLHIVNSLSQLMGGGVELARHNPGTEFIVRAPFFLAAESAEPMRVDDFFTDNMVQLELSGL